MNTIFLATFLFAAACSDGYDDTRIKKDLDDVGQILDELEQAVDGLRTQMDALTQLINSSFVSLISTDAEGNYVITYIDRGGESRTLTLATQKEVVTLPIVGIAKDEDGVWYWRQTSDNGETYEWILVDGEKVPAGGEKPEVGIDAEGFWTVNGKPITDAKGNKVLADDVSNILFKEAYVDEKDRRSRLHSRRRHRTAPADVRGAVRFVRLADLHGRSGLCLESEDQIHRRRFAGGRRAGGYLHLL